MDRLNGLAREGGEGEEAPATADILCNHFTGSEYSSDASDSDSKIWEQATNNPAILEELLKAYQTKKPIYK